MQQQVRKLHSTSLAAARFPVLYVPETRRQSVRVATKNDLLVKEGKDAHVLRRKDRAAVWKRLNRAASAAFDLDSSSSSSAQMPIRQLLFDNTVTPNIQPHNLKAALTLAANLATESATTTTAAAAATASTASTASSSENADSVRSFKRTTVAGAKPEAAARAPTRYGIEAATIADITTAVDGLTVGSVTRGPSFAYGITAAEAKTVLVDAPKHLTKLAERLGKNNAYDAVVSNESSFSSSTTSSSSNPSSTATTAAIVEPAEMAELLRRQISLENASQQQKNAFNRRRVVEIFGRKQFDTGSPEVQAAVFTVKINAMQQHLTQFKKDKSSKRQLQAIQSKRDRVLKYLRRTDLPKFVETCRALGVEPDTIRSLRYFLMSLMPRERRVSWSTASASEYVLTGNSVSPLPPIPNGKSDDHSDHQQQTIGALMKHHTTHSPAFPDPPQLQQSSPTEANATLRVCRCCQDQLMTVFDHCLSRHHDATEDKDMRLASFHQIDEVEDAKITTLPPQFDVIKDPTLKANAIFDDIQTRLERDRSVFCESQILKNYRHGKGPTFGTSKFFSGALYKKTIEEKDREIRQLREKLYDKSLSEKLEQENVKHLKVALTKSMKYYCYAEEWQSQESSRLQQDVRYLKAEMSSLMAFLINSEEEKRMMLLEIEGIRNVSQAKDDERLQIERQRDDYKQKLQDAYNEYLATSEVIAKLKKEAEHGSDTIISRNEVLQRNIDKISRDFEVAAKELAAANLRVKDLQFELDEMVQQFNITGQGQRTAEELNGRLTAELSNLNKTYEDLKHLQTETALRVVNLESDMKKLQQLLELTTAELENQAAELQKELDAITEVKRELEGHLKNSRGEVEKLSMALKSLTRSKDQIETAFRIAVQKHEKEILNRDNEIKELQRLRVEDALVLKKVQEVKEQLMFQVTDLQNNLDRELSNVNVLSFELSQLKRTSEEKIFNLEESVEKLTSSKVNLANDKRLLTEKLRVIRADLATKEDQLEKLTAEFTEFKANSSETEAGLRQDLKVINGKHDILTSEHKTLNQKQAVLTEANLDLVVEREGLKKQVANLEQQNETCRTEIGMLTYKNADLMRELEGSVGDRNEMKIHLDSVLGKLAETTSILNQERYESSNTIKEKTEEIIKMSADLYKVKEDRERLDALSLLLQSQVARLEIELSDTKAALAAETLNKEQFEVHLYELRRNLMSERSLRLDFERMHTRIDRKIVARELEKLGAMRARDRKLMEVSKQLQSELGRLTTIEGML
ncbi:UNVERIFIED_CONTAM: hypothetical protein HDU68_002585, partial [Siphonaria sp. JEL0065]